MLRSDADNQWGPSCTLDSLRKRAWMLSVIRRFFATRHVLEVETPNLCHSIGTAVHLSFFSTEYVDSGITSEQHLYLQNSPEFAMKRLLAAGSGSIYQVCKAYRKQESGRYHNPEFSLLEWYRVGFDLSHLMDDVEALILKLFNQSAVTLASTERLPYRDAFYKYTGIDVFSASLSEFGQSAKLHGLVGAADLCQDNIPLWLDFLFSHLVQPQLGQGKLTFIFDYPGCQCELARTKYQESEIAERMEVFIYGVELANGYYELIDLVEQERRFRRDLDERGKRGLPLPPIDERFLQSLDFGLPDCSGVAVGLDRLLMLLSGVDHIDKVLAFPINRA